MICENITRDAQGTLCFGGANVVKLIEKYGSPLYIMDESRIRTNCNAYVTAMKKYFGESAMPLYAGKAAAFKEIYRIVNDEKMGIDVVSSGEIYTACAAGFPMKRAYFHSNNKTDEDIKYAIQCGVGHFVVDNIEELTAIEQIAAASGRIQPILLRLTPGIDPHTYEAVSTGKVDSKFGSAIKTGQAAQIVSAALGCLHIRLDGFHCHVGSQVFDSDVFLRASDIMLEFIAEVKQKFGYNAHELDLGGGYGVRYVEEDPVLDLSNQIHQVADFIHKKCAELHITEPAIRLEPGRSIVADAGMTVYTVGTVKKIPGYKNYVSVDGGMTDNPRFALYQSRYTVMPVENADESEIEYSVVGRCCESGDIIQEHVKLPANIHRGAHIAVATTGAYNYSMASNYNRIARLPVVMVRNGTDRLVVRRETMKDLVRNDI